jgi:hypothetical protein
MDDRQGIMAKCLRIMQGIKLLDALMQALIVGRCQSLHKLKYQNQWGYFVDQVRKNWLLGDHIAIFTIRFVI